MLEINVDIIGVKFNLNPRQILKKDLDKFNKNKSYTYIKLR